ncbi:MAG TPA: TfuA-like protein [Stellaceae bacterium]|nr:TfuA-like protein [Stellaceae bacterium]
MTTVVFLGPTLPLDEARRLLDATYLPPARQGDIYRAARDLRPVVIGLVDGTFRETPAVWHREILWALASGIHVFGASSMGALRAAELAPFGMRGVGTVFEAYRNGVFPPYPPPFDADDEVAVTHGPAESRYIRLSEALVDIRDALARAAEAGAISLPMRDSLLRLAKQTFYPNRVWRSLLRAANGLVDTAELDRLAGWLRDHPVSRKRLDAEAMLIEIGRFLETSPAPFVPGFRFENTSVWARFQQAADRGLDRLTEREAAALAEVRLNPPEWQALRRRAVLRRAALADPLTELPPPASVPDDLRTALHRLQRRLGFATRAQLDAWMRDHGFDPTGFARFVADEARLDALASGLCGIEREILDQLRLSGAFPAFAERGLAKRAYLAALDPADRPDEAAVAELLARYAADHLGGFVSADPADDLAEHAVALGYPGEAELAAALVGEYLFGRAQPAGV